MGNKFETLSTNFSHSERYTILMPPEIERALEGNLKTPYAMFDFCMNLLKEPCFKFSYTINIKDFINLCQKHTQMENDGDLLSIFNLFAVQQPELMTGEVTKVVNVLEFLTSLILLASYGENSATDLQHNAEAIEHKLNLLLLLFDFRKTGEMNISEIIIMMRTALLSLAKVFPTS